jgi:hypothetical protein
MMSRTASLMVRCVLVILIPTQPTITRRGAERITLYGKVISSDRYPFPVDKREEYNIGGEDPLDFPQHPSQALEKRHAS